MAADPRPRILTTKPYTIPIAGLRSIEAAIADWNARNEAWAALPAHDAAANERARFEIQLAGARLVGTLKGWLGDG